MVRGGVFPDQFQEMLQQILFGVIQDEQVLKTLIEPAMLVKIFYCQHVMNAVCELYLDGPLDRKSTRLNSSHSSISYAVFCLKINPPIILDCSFYTHSCMNNTSGSTYTTP